MSTAHIARALSAMDEPFVRYKIRLNVSARPPREREIRILRAEIRRIGLWSAPCWPSWMLQAASPCRRATAGAVAHWVLYMLADLGLRAP